MKAGTTTPNTSTTASTYTHTYHQPLPKVPNQKSETPSETARGGSAITQLQTAISSTSYFLMAKTSNILFFTVLQIAKVALCTLAIAPAIVVAGICALIGLVAVPYDMAKKGVKLTADLSPHLCAQIPIGILVITSGIALGLVFGPFGGATTGIDLVYKKLLPLLDSLEMITGGVAGLIETKLTGKNSW